MDYVFQTLKQQFASAIKGGPTMRLVGIDGLHIRFVHKVAHRISPIFDGHGSHVSSEFVEYAISCRYVFLGPAHSTHHFQPLDVGLFSPLAKAYKRRFAKIPCMVLSMSQKVNFSKYCTPPDCQHCRSVECHDPTSREHSRG